MSIGATSGTSYQVDNYSNSSSALPEPEPAVGASLLGDVVNMLCAEKAKEMEG
jgi:hypothetical protein